MNQSDVTTTTNIQLLVEHVADIVYCHQALAARLSADIAPDGRNTVPLPPASHRGVLAEPAMRQLMDAVADLGFIGSMLPVDEMEAQVELPVKRGMAEEIRHRIHDAAAYGLLAWMLDGICNDSAVRHRRMRTRSLALAAQCLSTPGDKHISITPNFL